MSQLDTWQKRHVELSRFRIFFVQTAQDYDQGCGNECPSQVMNSLRRRILYTPADLKDAKVQRKASPQKTVQQVSRECMQARAEMKSEGVLGKLSVDQLREVAGRLGVGSEGLKPNLVSRIAPVFGDRWITLQKALDTKSVSGWLKKQQKLS